MMLKSGNRPSIAQDSYKSIHDHVHCTENSKHIAAVSSAQNIISSDKIMSSEHHVQCLLVHRFQF